MAEKVYNAVQFIYLQLIYLIYLQFISKKVHKANLYLRTLNIRLKVMIPFLVLMIHLTSNWICTLDVT